MTDEETAAVDALIADHADEGRASFTRRDPKNTGPLLVTISGRVFQVDGATVEEL